MADCVTRFYDNKQHITDFYRQYDGTLYGHGRYLKAYLTANKLPANPDEKDLAYFARQMYINCKVDHFYVYEVDSGCEAEYAYEITLMGNEFYIAVYHNDRLAYYGKPEDMPVNEPQAAGGKTC